MTLKLMVDWEDRRIMTEEEFLRDVFPQMVEEQMAEDCEFPEWLENNYDIMTILNKGLTKEQLFGQFKAESLAEATANAQEIVDNCWSTIVIKEER